MEERGLELLEQRDALLEERNRTQATLDAIADEAPAVLAAVADRRG